jgi:hypothetical protein
MSIVSDMAKRHKFLPAPWYPPIFIMALEHSRELDEERIKLNARRRAANKGKLAWREAYGG